MKKIITVVIGDSLGVPRPWVGLNLRRTYAFQLATFLGDHHYVCNYSVASNSSVQSVKKSFLRTYITGSDLSYAVIQLGIVDCAPRLLTDFDRCLAAIAARSRLFDLFFKPYVNLKSRHRYWITKNFPKTLVPLHLFEASYQALVDELIKTNAIKKIYLLDIAYPGDYLIQRSFNIIENVKNYNNVIQRIAQERPALVETISIFEQTKANLSWITVEDGHHLMPEAHDWIAQQLHIRIQSS